MTSKTFIPGEKKYEYFYTYFDKEMLRKALLLLNQEGVDFKVSDKSGRGSVRAPLSVYVETDILVSVSDFDRAAKILDLPTE